MLGAQGLLSREGSLWRAIPTATRDLGLYGLIWKTGTYVPQWDSNPRRKDDKIIAPDALTTAPHRRLSDIWTDITRSSVNPNKKKFQSRKRAFHNFYQQSATLIVHIFHLHHIFSLWILTWTRAVRALPLLLLLTNPQWTFERDGKGRKRKTAGTELAYPNKFIPSSKLDRLIKTWMNCKCALTAAWQWLLYNNNFDGLLCLDL